MRGDARIIGLVALLLCTVGYFTVMSPSGSQAAARASRTAREDAKEKLALKDMIEKLSVELDNLKGEISRNSAQRGGGGGGGRAAAGVSSSGSAAALVGGPWERGPTKQREDEKVECEEWLAGKRDTYMHSPEARKHVNPGGFTSQYRQDKQLYKRFFSKMNRPGVYLDIAANHYKVISNTYFTDRCLGWSGICVEPNPVYHPGLLSNRSCAVVPKCISDKIETVKFTFPLGFWEAQLGGVEGGQFKGRRPDDKAFQDVTIECETVQGVLDKAGVKHVDFFSIDVEGHERKLLAGIDFSKVTFDVILCESHCGETLKANGYAKIAMPDMAGGDKVFLRKDGPYGDMLPEVPIE